MSTLDLHEPCTQIKMLNVADSGTGKTGAIASLVKAGYSVRFQDFDNGLAVLRSLLTEVEQKRVHVETLQDPIMPGLTGPKFTGEPKAFTRACQLLSGWKSGDVDLGPIKSWTTNDILVIDSFTFLNSAVLRFIQKLNGRLGEHPSQHEYGLAMDRVTSFLNLISSSAAVPCHVIINCHMKFLHEPGESREFKAVGQGEIEVTPMKCYPYALGKALPPQVQSFFNTVITMSTIGATHWIHPESTQQISCKNPVPKLLKSRLPIETGMAEIFEKILGHSGPSTTTK